MSRGLATSWQRWRSWWGGRRLVARLVSMSLLVLLLVQAAGFALIRESIMVNAHQQLDQRIALGGRVWAQLLDQRASRLQQGATVLAADYGFREALASHDRETLASALDNHRQRIAAGQAALLDTNLKVVATHEGALPALTAALEQLAPQLASPAAPAAPAAAPGPAAQREPQASRGLVALVNGQAVQWVMVPVRAPVVVGWVAMGFPLDDRLAREMAALSGLQATLLAQPMRAAPRSLASSLEPEQAQALASQLADGDLLLGDEQHLVRTVSLASGPEGRLTLRLSGSLDAAVAPYQRLQWLLAGVTLLGLVLFGLASHWVAQRVTRPLRQLARASEALARGDWEKPLVHGGAHDEVGELTRSFEHMRQGLADQQQALRQLAFHDRLTGLPNRVALRDHAAAAIDAADPSQQRLAVLMLGLDRFKHVNDVLGYAFGDRVLCSVADRLRGLVRDGDHLARLGGDEFALLLHDAGLEEAQRVAQRLVQCFEQPVTLDDQTVDLSAGIGIALWPSHALAADTLLSHAEVAMSAAKRRTGGAQVYDPAVDTASAQTLSLLSQLRRAVECNELRLFLQPKIDIGTGLVCGAEALVRWQHPQRGLVPPLQFIPFAEQTGFIRQLTLWMFEQVAQSQSALAKAGVRRVAVNLSTRDLMDQELPEKLEAILRRHGARAEGYCLEITESAIMDDPERAEATLNRLSERGYKLSIDDFGTGYSSLAYLRRLPVSELKIDKSFVMGMERNTGDATIVRSTIDLAHNLGLSVVAEGVENEPILRLLHDLHCDEGQGYHMSKPLPLDGFMDWCAAWQVVPPQTLAGSTQAVLAQLH
ncbi:MAG: EAL domain-containing protein [Burkholderiaceae bacterium]|nr:EAL domain-containing protein [Burkholderiaceae bacterium]